ncbi:hypothetical protein A5641_22625 [Mycobacterium sp. 1554424.7]|nr:hypothetical protein A5641_22625 [Mycobacterium sp. 1554424.7]
MSATRNPTRSAGQAVAIDGDVELITGQIEALKDLARLDDETPISEGQRYDFSIRWGTVLAGRLRRLVHYSSLGRLTDTDERTLDALRTELRSVNHLIGRFRLAQPNFADSPPAKAKRFGPRR